MSRLKILLSAYACLPFRGSEPGVGWNLARELSRLHDVWLLTRESNRTAIEAELRRVPVHGLHVHYFKPAFWPEKWNERYKNLRELHYYLWQIGASGVAGRLHSQIGFDLAHHLTYARYWTPSALALLSIPFVWGPVGGGESAPRAFYPGSGWRGHFFEAFRDVARWLGEHDPLVRLTARRSALVLATTPHTAVRLAHLKAERVELFSACGLSGQEINALGRMARPADAPVRFISVGRLLHWKGFHLGLQAFARAGLDSAEYWVVGEGPEEGRLRRLADDLGIGSRVRFRGALSHSETLAAISRSHVLVHPSLHDSGGMVVVEAMAARRPVICLDLGGPASQITPETGFKLPAHSPLQAVDEIARVMRRIACDRELQHRLGDAGHQRVKALFSWESKADAINQVYTGLQTTRLSFSSTS